MLVFTVIMPLLSSSPHVYYIIELCGPFPNETWYCYCTLKNVFHSEWQDKLAVLWLFLKCISLRHCLPWFSYRNALHTSCQIERTPFFLEWTLKPLLKKPTSFFFFFFLTPDVNWTQNIHHYVVNIIAFTFWVISGTGLVVPKVVCLPYINLKLSSSFGSS